MKIRFVISVFMVFGFVNLCPVLAQSDQAGMEKYFNNKMKKSDRIGMQVAYVANGELAWAGSYGVKQYDKSDSVNDSTVFMVASISKPVTALAIMKLYDEGKISLDDNVNQYLPFALFNPHCPDQLITIRMLLTHVSSLRDNWDVLELGYTIDQGGDSPMSLAAFLKSYLVEGGENYDAERNFLKTEPGKVERYSNVGYGLLGYLVERISGRPFNLYMAEEVFKPLHMNNTFWFLSEVPHDNIATPHNMPYKETDYKGTQVLTHFGYPNYPSGQLRTTVTDYAQIVKLMLNNGRVDGRQFISKATVEEFLRVQNADIEKWRAISWSYNEFESPIYYMLMPRYPSHTGLDPGMSSVVSFDPNTGRGAIIFSNSPTTTLRSEKIIYLDMVKRLFKEAKKTTVK
ncbi:MAG: beta-lactamase family protein [Cyclobacteriaceae bacterium]|nr:beta-lactamase family protein [Cyclobacteriaceae bacterium]